MFVLKITKQTRFAQNQTFTKVCMQPLPVYIIGVFFLTCMNKSRN